MPQKTLSDLKPGDVVIRTYPRNNHIEQMVMNVTEVHGGLIICGGLAFDRENGIEIDVTERTMDKRDIAHLSLDGLCSSFIVPMRTYG